MPRTPDTRDTAQVTLKRLRLVWGATLLSQVLFLIVMLVVMKRDGAAAIDPAVLRTLHIASLGFMLVAIPGGYMTRMQSYKRHWRVSEVAPAGYFMGNLVLLAMCEATALFAVAVAWLAGAYIPYLIPWAVAVAMVALSFPDGKPMQPREPEL